MGRSRGSNSIIRMFLSAPPLHSALLCASLALYAISNGFMLQPRKHPASFILYLSMLHFKLVNSLGKSNFFLLLSFSLPWPNHQFLGGPLELNKTPGMLEKKDTGKGLKHLGYTQVGI